MGSINSIQVSDSLKQRASDTSKDGPIDRAVIKGFDDMQTDFVQRWNHGVEGGEERDFGDRLISAVQDIGGEVGNFFNSSVVTKRERLKKIQDAKTAEREDNEKRVRMLVSNTERGLAAGETDTPAQGQRPTNNDFTTDARIFNTNLGDKK